MPLKTLFIQSISLKYRTCTVPIATRCCNKNTGVETWESSQKSLEVSFTYVKCLELWLNVPAPRWPPPTGKTGKQTLCENREDEVISWSGLWSLATVWHRTSPAFLETMMSWLLPQPYRLSAVKYHRGHRQVTLSITTGPSWAVIISWLFINTLPPELYFSDWDNYVLKVKVVPCWVS